MAFGFGFGMPRSFATPFSPASLFATGAPGAWYDPSDRTTLFQDSAGTTPVTAVEQPVGLMLDKSQGLVLGPQLVTNGALWTAVAPTTSVWTPATSTLRVTGGTGGGTYYNFTSVVGTYYKLTFTVSVVSAGTWYVIPKSAANGGGSNILMSSDTTSKTVTLYFAAATTTSSLYVQITNGGVIDVTGVALQQLPGNHAFQSTAASRPVLSARYNLLIYSEQFNNAAWAKSNVTITTNATTAPDGTTTADFALPNGVGPFVAQNFSVISGQTYTISFYAKKENYDFIRVNFSSAGFTVFPFAWFDLTNGTVGTTANTSTTSIVNVGNGWYRCSITKNATTTTTSAFGFAVGSADNVQTSGDGTSGIYIWGADLRVANDGVGIPYQRVNTSTDYDSGTAFPRYLRFDGVDDSLSTNNINFTSTDKMSVFAGVRKLSDAATAMLVELSTSLASNNGTCYFTAPESGGTTKFAFSSKGTVQVTAPAISSIYNAPITSTLTGLGDISGDSVTLRINGAQVAQNTGDQGTGNYGNYPLYIGRRGGTSLPFNGQLYSMIIVGKAVTAGELSSSETYTASKTGVTLA